MSSRVPKQQVPYSRRTDAGYRRQRRVVITDPQDAKYLLDIATTRNYPPVKATEMEALMEAQPHQELLTVPTNEDKEWVVELCEKILTELEPWEQDIVALLVYQRLSLRVAGRLLKIPKTTLARRRDEIWHKIEKQLLDHPEVREYIYGH